MKKRTIILFSFVFIGINQLCVAQQLNKIDSLLHILKTEKEDTSKVNTLNLLGKESCITGDYNQTRKYSDEALHLSEKLHFDKGKIMALMNHGNSNFYEGDYPESLKKYSEALSIGKKIKNKKLIAYCYNYIGLTYTYQRNYSKATDTEQLALQLQQEVNDSAETRRGQAQG